MDNGQILKSIELAFTPASDVRAPLLFCGRRTEAVKGLRALRSDGASICIYGGRGVGKSSLATQLMLVGAGLEELTTVIERPDLFDADRFKMPNIYFCCDSTITTTEDLFRKLTTERNTFSGIAKYHDGAIVKRITETTNSDRALSLRLLSAASQEGVSLEAEVPHGDFLTAFKTVTSEVVEAWRSNALIVVIDDFELVADKVGMASVIRSTPHVKFVLVGVSDDYRALVSDHQSVSRQLGEGLIHLEPMDEAMLEEILSRAERVIERLQFTKSARARIVHASRGYPYWVHRLGKDCCFIAVERGASEIDDDVFEAAVEQIVKDDVSLEDRYCEAVANDRSREAVLKTLAAKRKGQSVGALYSKLETKLDLTAQQVDSILRSLEESGVLGRSREGFYSFQDPIFSGYVGFRLPLFEDNQVVVPFPIDLGSSTGGGLATYAAATDNAVWITGTTDEPSFELDTDHVLNSYRQASSVSSLAGEPLLYDHAGKVIKHKGRTFQFWRSDS